MSRFLSLSVLAVALSWAAALPEFATAQSTGGQRWRGPYKGPGVTFPSTGRGNRTESSGVITYRYNTPRPSIPFQSIRSADPGSMRSTPAPSLHIPRSNWVDHR